MRRVKDACARGAAGIAVGCQGIITLPNLRMNLASLQSLHAYIRIEDRVLTSKPVCEKLGIKGKGSLTRA
jgi:hypothetical protein